MPGEIEGKLTLGLTPTSKCPSAGLVYREAYWVMEKARGFKKNIYFCFIDYAKAFDCVDHSKLWKILRDGNTRPSDLPLEKPMCRSGSNS